MSAAARADGLGEHLGRTPLDAMSSLLAESWWLIALRGLLAIVFGIVALIMPVAVMLSLALLFAVYLFIDGVLAISSAVRAARTHEHWALLLAEGVLDLIMSAVVALFPLSAVLAFVLITAAWALLTGGLLIATAFRIGHGRWWLAFGGIVSIVWGVLLIIAPIVGALVLTWWLGGYAITFGIMLLVFGFRLRHHRMPRGAAMAASPAR